MMAARKAVETVLMMDCQMVSTLVDWKVVVMVDSLVVKKEIWLVAY
jgi:hypothetical protein